LIVVDSSPLIAILQKEDDAAQFRETIGHSERVILGAANKLEVMMVAGGRKGSEGLRAAQALLDEGEIEVVAFSEELADIATEAFLRYGKGRGHKAQLNFGDCMAYALARSLDAPLLYKGGDFALTDIRSALD
jgi:ribonuclease VapC